MSITHTVLHVQGHRPEAVEEALAATFAREERPPALRIEGTYSAVLARATDPDLDASYRYLILRPHGSSTWTPVLELGNRTDGLDVELSRALGGAPVFTIYDYGDVVSGYRLARAGALVDQYTSDPTSVGASGWMPADPASLGALPAAPDFPLPAGTGAGGEDPTPPADDDMDVDIEGQRGHPERFADLLPAGTSPDDFARVVLLPGWWEDHDAAVAVPNAASEGTDDEDELVDETDRMRCIGLALELWAPDEYPLAQDPEDIPNAVAGPAIALAFS